MGLQGEPLGAAAIPAGLPPGDPSPGSAGPPRRGPQRRRLSKSVAKARIAPERQRRIVDIPRFFSPPIPVRGAFATDLDRIPRRPAYSAASASLRGASADPPGPWGLSDPSGPAGLSDPADPTGSADPEDLPRIPRVSRAAGPARPGPPAPGPSAGRPGRPATPRRGPARPGCRRTSSCRASSWPCPGRPPRRNRSGWGRWTRSARSPSGRRRPPRPGRSARSTRARARSPGPPRRTRGRRRARR